MAALISLYLRNSTSVTTLITIIAFDSICAAQDEKKRIEDLGGVVVWFGTWRVNGNIAVSRAIGKKDEQRNFSHI